MTLPAHCYKTGGTAAQSKMSSPGVVAHRSVSGRSRFQGVVAHVSGHYSDYHVQKRQRVHTGLASLFNHLRIGGHAAASPQVNEESPASTSQFLDNIIEEAERGDAPQDAESQQQAELPQSSSSESDNEDYSQLNDRIGFIGAGQMGEALIRGFIATGVSTPDKICASVRSSKRKAAMKEIGIKAYGDALDGGAAQVAQRSDIIIIAVKPIYVDSVLEALRPHITPDHLIISIVAGVKLGDLESSLPDGTRVIRVMPNTPCLIGQCASAYVTGNVASEEDSMKTFSLMSAVGMTTSVEERMMDAVTGLSGSGPAYVFLIIEAMADGAVLAGLPREKALALAAQTVVGASRMVLEAAGDGTVTHPAVLKDKVASPAGTTIAGLLEMESSGVRGAMMRAVKASAKRSEELG